MCFKAGDALFVELVFVRRIACWFCALCATVRCTRLKNHAVRFTIKVL